MSNDYPDGVPEGEAPLTDDLEGATPGTGVDGEAEASPEGEAPPSHAAPDGGDELATMTPEQLTRSYRELQRKLGEQGAELGKYRERERTATPEAEPAPDPQEVEKERRGRILSPAYTRRVQEYQSSGYDEQAASTMAINDVDDIYSIAKEVAREIVSEQLAPLQGLVQAEVVPSIATREITQVAGADVDANAILSDLADVFGLPVSTIPTQLQTLAPALRRNFILRSAAMVRQQQAESGTGTVKAAAQRAVGTLAGHEARRQAQQQPVNTRILNEYRQMFPDLSDAKIMERHGHAIERGMKP